MGLAARVGDAAKERKAFRMELVTTHTHTAYTGHGHGTVAELAAAASAAGVSTLAVTEHFPMSAEMDPTNEISMAWDNLDRYRADIAKAAAAHPEMQVVCGCEVDWLGSDEDRDLASCDFSPYGIVLGSVHFVDGWAFDDPAEQARWDEVGVDEVWRRYFEVWCEAASCQDAPFTCMAHPDLVKKFGFRPSYDLASTYASCAEAVESTGRMIELNTSGATYPCAEMFPAPAMLATFCRAGIPCTIGSDAHDPALVVRNIREGYRVLYDAGYRCITVPTPDGDRREIPLA